MNYLALKSFFASKNGIVLALALAAIAVTGALFVQAAEAPLVTAQLRTDANAEVASAVIGTNIHARAVVSAATTSDPVPGGTVDIIRYANTSCTGTSTTEAGIALVNGAADSATTSVPATGLSYKVHYNGQTSIFPAGDSACASVTAIAAATSVATTLSNSTVVAGSSAHSSATLNGVTSDAGGTVAYTVWNNSACTTGARSAGIKTVTNGIAPDSDALAFPTAGTFYWQAVYSGDAHNAAATSSCASGALTVTSVAPTTAHLIVDEIVKPAGDSTVFHFDGTGDTYADFDLAGTSTPNDQVLAPGSYTITQSPVAGYTLSSAKCKVNGGAAASYVPGATLSLSAGDSVFCTFTTVKDGFTDAGGTIGKKTHFELNAELIAFLRSIGYTGDIGIEKVKSNNGHNEHKEKNEDKGGHGKNRGHGGSHEGEREDNDD